MAKTELMEKYTEEQLAEMVVSKQNIIDDMKSSIDFLNSSLERKERIINQIDDIMEKLFGVRHDTVDNPDEFEKILTDRVKWNVYDLLPTEPIKVADLLINAYGEFENNPVVKKILGKDKDTYRIFDISELRQIAEHLLVYCNANGESEE